MATCSISYLYLPTGRSHAILCISTPLEGFIFHFVPLGTKCIDTSRVHNTRDVSHISPSAKHEGLYEMYPESWVLVYCIQVGDTTRSVSCLYLPTADCSM